MCGRSLLLHKDIVFPHGTYAVHDRIYPYDSCARVSGGAHPPDGGGSGDRAGQPQAHHSGYPAAAPSNFTSATTGQAAVFNDLGKKTAGNYAYFLYKNNK